MSGCRRDDTTATNIRNSSGRESSGGSDVCCYRSIHDGGCKGSPGPDGKRVQLAVTAWGKASQAAELAAVVWDRGLMEMIDLVAVSIA